MSANIETMVSANGVIPWHKQGDVLSGYPSIEVMYEHSGLDWDVSQIPMEYQYNGSYITAPNMFCNIRSSDGACLGVSSERYNVYQNRDAFDWCKPLMDTGLWKMETAGSLRGGKLCWALLNQGENEVINGDVLKNYLLVHWSHDGAMAIRVGMTSIRVVCNNTLDQALNQDRATITRVYHNSKMFTNMDGLQQLYRKTTDEFLKQRETFHRLSEFTLDKDEKADYLEHMALEILPLREFESSEQEKRHAKAFDRLMDDLNVWSKYGSGIQELKQEDTAWGIFNGVQEYIEKAQGGKKVRDRGFNILLGNGKKLADEAFSTICNVAGVAVC